MKIVKSEKLKTKSFGALKLARVADRRALIVLCFSLLVFSFSLSTANAQRRDYMTDQESEIARNAQDVDVRIDVLTKMIDRRFTLLGIDANGWKGTGKKDSDWGPNPWERERSFSPTAR